MNLPKFEIGQHVIVKHTGAGVGPNEMNKVVKIIEVGEYSYGAGYKVEPAIGNTLTGQFNGFIGQGSFELTSKYIQRKIE